MNIAEFRDYCLNFKSVSEDLPFDNKTLVFKVMGKIFALTDIDDFDFINLKCEPEKSFELREKYEGITPGFHMNKKMWNSVSTKSDVSDSEIKELINISYDLIVHKLPKKIKDELEKS